MPKRQMLLCDIPDGHQSVGDYLDDIREFYPEVSYDNVREAIRDVEIYGRIVTGCVPVAPALWRLPVAIGFGHKAHIMFVELKSGNYLAIHAFTSKTEGEIEPGVATGVARRLALG
jgi:hypothetical protein